MHEEQEEITKHVQKILLYLAQSSNQGVTFNSKDLFNGMDVPREYHNYVLSDLHEPRYIRIVNHGTYVDLQIDEKGLKEADIIAQRVFEETGINPLAQMIQKSLEETCIEIFNKHKAKDNSLQWNKMTFYPNTPDNIHAAKDTMLHQGVISHSHTRAKTTILNPLVSKCSTYFEAVEKLNELSKPSPTNSINIAGSVGGNVQTGSGNQLLDFRENSPAFTPIQKETTDAKKINQEDGVLKKACKVISENKIISSVVTGVILLLIYYLIVGKWPNRI